MPTDKQIAAFVKKEIKELDRQTDVALGLQETQPGFSKHHARTVYTNIMIKQYLEDVLEFIDGKPAAAEGKPE